MGSSEYQETINRRIRGAHEITAEQIIAGLALNQVKRWLARGPLRLGHLLDLVEPRIATANDMFLFWFRDGQVDPVTARGEPMSQLATRTDEHSRRAKCYLRLFRHAAADEGFAGYLAMSMHDGPASHPEIPFFAFQKPRGLNSILLPDIDLLSARGYESLPPDPFRFAEKSTSAVFAGSTTGGRRCSSRTSRMSPSVCRWSCSAKAPRRKRQSAILVCARNVSNRTNI